MAFKSPFEIENTSDELTVRKQTRTPTFNTVVSIGLVVYMLLRFLPLLSPSSHESLSRADRSGDVFFVLIMVGLFLFATGALIFQVIRDFFPSGETLHCDRQSLVIGKIPTTNFHGEWTYITFPIAAVKQMRWGALRVSRYGSRMGLIFLADGKTYKLLSGLEAPEANTILDALQHLHVDIVRDPTMPMLMEMAESKRKSWVRFFLT